MNEVQVNRMADEELFKALDGLFAYDMGFTDSGIHDERLRQRVIAEIKAERGENKAGPRLTRFAARFVEPPCTLEDMAAFIEWLDDHMQLML
jgi:hypothetical protein